ncbi:UDP-N-acetylmuramoyl-tripeptide--D-alanyl-D-alanine ligase [Halomonas sp. MCCC 1A17488]|uniref:UDP-N-acetylmuramoyl-tripeptide--D-alanyl-D-alanine ligase n=1 Tax=Billgrantia sulfidoxydans TaxID=2733484 RepID=A0ABX7W5V5_9GAMM|nr:MULTISPECIES: UDP-N-acetylmuramoyl-tripeptide--D-alanyl-D-alanine ligase [Halomonas]MCE8014645.1 UDP-N-acetylmuramoyl-tripeptide--D-alanyl-D-alanine ligase [Halomonas sp. MCCC 1A17488]MCG3237978.1 UDP-N-acetylmuramoyl-tripeptide--D-alanyl-D-alanine ligase [Halomonas sp. MCCC 1A17488]QPP48240.1 UDP-N-acetylmuramoyl-tripeptide--D-alanyl-D-alanine ligase [Halomonas sp. SS10-MC5]QTP55540.1 UDP-N-acetylmuramoyl-tripeptide--D-alanyl-D-alanine ligase [Halomonas sulfidoxydans]
MSGSGLQSLAAVAEALGVAAPGHEVLLSDIVSDTRRLVPGSLFVALRGERFDAHDFIAQAREAGAAAALVERRVDDSLPQLVVPDTRLALGLLGRARRRAWGGPLVAVTGNSGKTSVKELLARLLGQRGKTLATLGNLNNDIGAPLTLLGLTAEHRQAVVELGANHLGEIAWTVGLAEPQVAIITNVTGAHVGEFGGMGQIAQAKGEILGGLGSDGVAVLNRDDVYFPLWARLAAPREVLDFGFAEQSRVRATELACDALGRYAFTLVADGRRVGRVQLALLGRHGVANALAAAAGALALGLDDGQLLAGLAAAAPMPGRLSPLPGIRECRLLDDSYNANPGAVKAALALLAELPGPRWCLLGAMGELGKESERLHAEVGRCARELGIDALLTCGEPALAASRAFGDGGYHFNDHEALTRHVLGHLPTGASVLIKGSRSAGMERVVAALRADASR